MRWAFWIVLISFFLCSAAEARTLDELLVEKGLITTAERDAVASPRVFYNDGTRIEFPVQGFALQVNTLLKNAYIYTDAFKGQPSTSSFETRNARLVLSGYALKQEFLYKLEYDAAINKLLDGFITWNTSDQSEIRFGQWKTAISRQFVNNSFKLMFPDASFASNYFNYGYQKSMKGVIKLWGGELVGGGAITNGNSDGEGPYAPAGVDTKNMLIADLRWNPVGKMNAYEEGDVNYTQDLALSFGTAYAYSPQQNEIQEQLQDLSVNRVNLDANLKYKGLGVNAEYYVSHEDPEFGESWTTQGAYAQAGYFLVTGKLEAAARWGFVDCDDGAGLGTCQGVDNYEQATAGLNYYFSKYNLRTQLAYDYLRKHKLAEEVDSQNRWMLQMIGMF